jgi:hypothetical protein
VGARRWAHAEAAEDRAGRAATGSTAAEEPRSGISTEAGGRAVAVVAAVAVAVVSGMTGTGVTGG